MALRTPEDRVVVGPQFQEVLASKLQVTVDGTTSPVTLGAALAAAIGGTVTAVSVVTANGVSATIATPTTTPAITIILGAITPTSIATPLATLGTVSSVTGQLKLANSASAFLTTIQAGNAAATRTYTWPTNFGAAGAALTDAAGNGTLSWVVPGGGGLTIGTTTITGGTDTRILRNNAGVLGEYTLTGTGTVAVMQTGAALITPALGVATGTSLALGGATIGSNVLAVTGSVLHNGVVGASMLTLTGATQTASFPVLDATQTWNNAGVVFTALKVNITNTASATGSLLFDVQAGGISQFNVGKSGQLLANGSLVFGGSNSGLVGNNALTLGNQNSAYYAAVRTDGGFGSLVADVAARIGFTSGAVYATSPDTMFSRAAAAAMQLGAADVATGAIAQTLQAQSNTGASTTGPDFTILGTGGTTAGGNLRLKTKATTTAADVLILTPSGLVQFLGSTSSFPALKRSATVLQARLADDSAFAPLQGALRTAANAVTGLTAGVLAALTNASIVITDASGQDYRVACII